jgi:hypothetical protein
MRPLLTLVLGIIWLMPASWCFASVDRPSLVTDPSLITLITGTGDDVFATTDLTTLLDPTRTNATQHYGPYPSTSTDSGTCGNDWANDTFDRHFTVRRNPDGTFLVVEQFKDGTFTTPAIDSPPVNFSPGACQTSATPQGTVNDNVTGSLHGYFLIPLPPGEMLTSSDPHCNASTMTNAGCDTTTFIDTHFTPACYPGTCTVTTFFFHYSAGDQQLIEHEWKNASADRGGNSGDIRSANLP